VKKHSGRILRKNRPFASAIILLTAATPIAAATLYVAKDGVDDSTCGARRDAACLTIQYTITNRSSAGDHLQIGPGVYPELVVLDRDLTLSGSPWDRAVIDGMRNGPVITVPSGVTAELKFLTVRNGFVSTSGTAALVAGISNGGTLTLFEMLVTGNATASTETANLVSSAGGIGNGGTLTISHSKIISNGASLGCISSGGLVNYGTVTIEESLIADNSLLAGRDLCIGPGTVPSASGIFNDGTAVVNTTTIQKNGIVSIGPFTLNRSTVSYSDSDGIYNTSILTVVNSTIFGSAFAGIYNAFGVRFGFLNMSNSTVAANAGGGVSPGPDSAVNNSILAGNPGGDCFAGSVSGDYNIVENGSGCTFLDGTHDLTGVSPDLGELRDNGGPTKTLYPMRDSPAVDGGNPAGCLDSAGDLIRVDQRGFPRLEPPVGHCDIGSVQVERRHHDSF
jgi:hypothetical protein